MTESDIAELKAAVEQAKDDLEKGMQSLGRVHSLLASFSGPTLPPPGGPPKRPTG